MTYSVEKIDFIEEKYNSDEQFQINSHLATEVDPYLMQNKLNEVTSNNWFEFQYEKEHIQIVFLILASLSFLMIFQYICSKKCRKNNLRANQDSLETEI